MRPVDPRIAVSGLRPRLAGDEPAAVRAIAELAGEPPAGTVARPAARGANGSNISASHEMSWHDLTGDALTLRDAAAELTSAVLLGLMLGVHALQEAVQNRAGRLNNAGRRPVPCHVRVPHVRMPHVHVPHVRLRQVQVPNVDAQHGASAA